MLDIDGGAASWNQSFLAMSYMILGEHEKARAAYERAIELAQDTPANTLLTRLLSEAQTVVHSRDSEGLTKQEPDDDGDRSDD